MKKIFVMDWLLLHIQTQAIVILHNEQCMLVTTSCVGDVDGMCQWLLSATCSSWFGDASVQENLLHHLEWVYNAAEQNNKELLWSTVIEMVVLWWYMTGVIPIINTVQQFYNDLFNFHDFFLYQSNLVAKTTHGMTMYELVSWKHNVVLW